MQARRDNSFDRIVERLENTAIIQERILGRLDALEKWREERDHERERAEDRRFARIDKAPDTRRADAAIVISAAMGVIYLISLLAQHWH